MFKKVQMVLLFFVSCWHMGQTAEYFNIPHVAESNWKTTITVYNVGNTDESFTLYHWDDNGILVNNSTHTVPAKGFTELISSDFGYDGIARVEVEDDANVKVKLSYQYMGSGSSESLCEFFINKGELGKKWFIPNPYQEHFHWFGLAFANHGDEDVNLTLTAYKHGSQVGQSVLTVSPKQKEVGISSGLWEGLIYSDVEMVSIESDIDICPPISITGNTSQSRHVFFSGTPHNTEGSVYYYYIPHVPDGDWLTTLTAYNITPDHEQFSLYVYDKDGNPGEMNAFGVSYYNYSDFTTANDWLIKGGTAYIKTYSPLLFKLSYRYSDRESICDFMLYPSKSKKWLLTNTFNSWFDWFGLAFANFLETDLEISLTAYKNGAQVARDDHTISTNQKKVALVDSFFSENTLGYSDVDMVMIETNQPMPIPISITGNNEQDRHVFFQGENLETNILFADQNFKDYLVANFDSNGDGEISYGEAAVVIEIDTPGENSSRGNITNLEGLQYFTGLMYLTAEYEQLESIPDISGLTNLVRLFVGDNEPLTQLPGLSNLVSLENITTDNTSITRLENLPASLDTMHCSSGSLTYVDLTGVDNLVYFRGGYNQIETLKGTSGLLNLKSLDVENNNITGEIDVTGNTSLLSLQANDNQITSVNITGCTALQSLKLYSNQLTTLTGFDDCSDIQSVYLNSNLLTSINISNKSELFMLRVNENDLTSITLTGLPALEELNIYDNPLTTIDLSSLSALKRFYCGRTELTSLDISNLTNLTEVWGSYSQLNSINFSGCTSLEKLYCSYCMFDDMPDVTGLPSIDQFYIQGNYFGEDDCPVIQNIEAMSLTAFVYNNQYDNSSLICP